MKVLERKNQPRCTNITHGSTASSWLNCMRVLLTRYRI